MSGFDVRLADAYRSRALTFFSTVGVGLALVFVLVFNRGDTGTDAEAAAPSTGPQAESVLAEGGEPEFLLRTGRDLIRAEHAVFTTLAAPSVESDRVRVRSGQTFASVLDDAGAGRVEAARAIAALESYFPARQLRAGQELNVYFETVADETGEEVRQFAGLSFRPDVERTLTVARTADGQFRAREATVEFERQMVRAQGAITTSLYEAALDLGATDKIIYDLANVLGFAVDFRTVQEGDTFDIVFERFVNARGETARTGEIVYIAFDGRGDPLEYFRYTTPDGEVGYYTGEGESAQRLLMKTPINGARLSSHFGRRFHPILQTSRPHNGTDFAAPTGTPIMAAGNGIVERADRYGSFGNYIRIRHANGYKTAYAHLNGFARGIRAGTRVTQGQTIGYVGTTGRSTGPHLHYEVHLNGRPVNPMSLELPTGRRLTEAELPLFIAERDRIAAVRDGAPAASDPIEREPVLVAQNRAGSGGAGRGETPSD
ncbi:M23 family metallopeptidase [Marinicauda algicola]|uniref:M23 family metallopeptidase n=1 Tax=Marinicauda algicola TaxID=2029849 RepID=A0A4S2GXF4_9PROT|nr:M23 family metallopeptidase [Marinicauda algicola]TGY87541.1 M23 family metallopeptidase [Marinicauda algicola]